MLFPFLPFLIEFLLPKVKEEDIGQSNMHMQIIQFHTHNHRHSKLHVYRPPTHMCTYLCNSHTMYFICASMSSTVGKYAGFIASSMFLGRFFGWYSTQSTINVCNITSGHSAYSCNLACMTNDIILLTCSHAPSSSYVWGALADKKGRKPVIIIGCLLVGLSSVAFGFSVKLYMAILFRFCVGLFNGESVLHSLIIQEIPHVHFCNSVGQELCYLLFQ